MTSNNTVSAELGLRLVTSQEAIIPMAGTFFYSREDPYAVRIVFHVGLDEPVEWTFARDLLSKGTESPQGIGDVQVWPSADSVEGEPGGVLNITLFSPAGPARFEVQAREISDFLRRTYQVVPGGTESCHIDLETEINDLLREAS